MAITEAAKNSTRTLDILTKFSNSSVREIEKLFVGCPICTASPCLGVYMSFVIARMPPQLSTSACVATECA